MMSAFAVGCIAGFLIAIPPGPVSVTTIARSVEHDRHSALMVGVGAVMSESMYAALGFFGVKLIYNAGLETAFRIVGFLIVTSMGARYAIMTTAVNLEPAKSPQRAKNSVWLGLALSVTTPTIAAAYVLVAATIQSYSLFENTSLNNAVAAVGAGTGSFLWLLLLVSGVGRMQKYFGVAGVQRIARIAGLLLLAVGGYLGYAIVERF